MNLTSFLKKNTKNHNDGQKAKIRVGDRGGVYIPSEEIAALPEVRMMQEMANAIVSRNTAIPRK